MRTPQSSLATVVIALILASVSLVLGVGAIAYRYYSAETWREFEATQNLSTDQVLSIPFVVVCLTLAIRN
ncbi:MAG: hypothetical protein MZW92_75355, partial [Comamonadaceae bacterium]|nr:hypothetical protein [Comamonadaceae bacterium]